MTYTIHVTARSNANAAAVFALLADASTWPSWSPIGSASLDRPGTQGALDEIRRFRTGRTTSVEQVVELVPDRRLSYILLSGLPLVDYRADIDLEPDGEGTLIHWRSGFRPGRPGSGWLYRLILRRFLKQMVVGLATAAERSPAGPTRSQHR